MLLSSSPYYFAVSFDYYSNMCPTGPFGRKAQKLRNDYHKLMRFWINSWVCELLFIPYRPSETIFSTFIWWPILVKLIIYILQNILRQPPLSSENKASKAGNWLLFSALWISFSVQFWENQLHLAPFSLARLSAARTFFKLKYPLFAPKTPLFNTRFLSPKFHFLTTISPFSTTYLMVREGFIYAIAADIYAFRLAFSTILPCI